MAVQTTPSALPAAPLQSLSEEKLERRLRALAWGEKQVLVDFLRHLEEFDRRRAYDRGPFPSLFQYCVRKLGLSEDEAYLRILAARLSREYPQVLEMLGQGQTHLSSLAKLSPHLRSANAEQLLEEARGKSKREVERIAARFGACLPRRDEVRWGPGAASPSAAGDAGQGVQLALSQDEPAATALEIRPSVSTEKPNAAVPASEGAEQHPAQGPRLVRISFTASEELLAKIERARALLRHKHPAGRLEQLVGTAFDALLRLRDPVQRSSERLKSPGKREAKAAGRRRIPRWVKSQVWRRDGGQCAFVAPDGGRCPAREWLEYDHILPFALGGSGDLPGNVRLLCKTHNGAAAREVFGAGPWGG